MTLSEILWCRKGWFPFSYTQTQHNKLDLLEKWVNPTTLVLIKAPPEVLGRYWWNVSSLLLRSFNLLSLFPLRHLPFSSLLLSKANSTSTGQLDKLVSPGLSGLTPESEEERALPPQRVSTFRPRPYSMADSNKVRGGNSIMWECGKCPHVLSSDTTDHLRLVLCSTFSNQVTVRARRSACFMATTRRVLS